MKNHKIILIIIFLTAFFIRIYNTNSYPPLLWDEAALGYNAYSILKTGKDEYGNFLPFIFKSFGDYKPGIYVYLTIPFVALFGLNELSVRLPSIIFGSLTPIFLYLLIKQINPKSNKLALISAVILSFNPYNIHFSKGAWETNILTSQIVLASYFFYKFINNQKNKYLLFSSLIFASTLYTYQAAKLISLLLVLILFSVNIYLIKKNQLKRTFIYFIIPLLILSLPLIFGLFFNSQANRLKVLSLFSYPRSDQETELIINETNQLDYNIFYNRFNFFLRNFLSRYFNHFSPKFLLFEGDWQNARHSSPYIGLILYPSILFLFFGIVKALSLQKIEKINLFFLLWLLLAPISSALTRDSVQAVRSHSFSIPLVYFISLGIYFFFKKYHNSFLFSMVFIAYLLSFIYYSDLFLNHLYKKTPHEWLYGYKQAALYTIENQNKYDHIYFTNFYGQPYIYYLFYSKYPPNLYQNQAKLTENKSGDTGEIEKIDKIEFINSSWQKSQETSNSLSIFSNDEILRQGINNLPAFNNFIPLSQVNGFSTFYAFENK